MEINERRKTMLRDIGFSRFLWVLVAALLVDPWTARADEAYYMIVFGQQDGANQPELSHTFATFVKVTGDGPDKTKYAIDSHTISWMPRSLEVKILRRPEEGVNLSLKDTLRHAQAIKVEVSMWGSFHIKKELYDRALRQEARLQKGDIDYKTLDVRFRPNTAMNCIHAVCDIDMDKGLLATGTAHGDEASSMALTHLSRWIIDYDGTHDWIGRRLELGKDIVRRDFQPKAADDVKK
jgi:hypothetical protein